MFPQTNYDKGLQDGVTRRDSLHALINVLPDPHYAVLRAMILHLQRVMDHSHENHMNSANLAVIFGPLFMGFASMAELGWQVRVVHVILQNTFQIFDGD